MISGRGATVIRPFADRDHEAVVALWAEAFPKDPSHNVSAEMIERKLSVQPELFLVATIDGTVVGAIIAGYDGVRGWLHRLAVLTSARRTGVGRSLVAAAEAGLRAMGCPKVNLQVRASNAEVIAFYEAIGYSVEDNISLARRL